jgi:UDP-glucose 4-epimerase
MTQSLRGANVLVVGGAGNIGSHVVDALVAEGAQITVYDTFARGNLQNLAEALTSGQVEVVEGDVGNSPALKAACVGKDFVFHLAAAWLLSILENPQLALTVNVQGTFNVLQAAVQAKVKKFIFSSAGAVYGDDLQVPVSEEHPLKPNTLYGASKAAGEQFCEAFARTFDLPYLALRYWNVYGPRADVRGNVGQIVPKWLDLLEEGKPPTIIGDGTSSMDFVYVTDVARANVLACLSPASNECLNIGSGIETTVNDLVDVLARVIGRPIAPTYLPGDGRPPQRRWCSIEKAERLIEFKPLIQLEEGLRRLIEWRQSSKINA